VGLVNHIVGGVGQAADLVAVSVLGTIGTNTRQGIADAAVALLIVSGDIVEDVLIPGLVGGTPAGGVVVLAGAFLTISRMRRFWLYR
jgi:hypothetical protein